VPDLREWGGVERKIGPRAENLSRAQARNHVGSRENGPGLEGDSLSSRVGRIVPAGVRLCTGRKRTPADQRKQRLPALGEKRSSKKENEGQEGFRTASVSWKSTVVVEKGGSHHDY